MEENAFCQLKQRIETACGPAPSDDWAFFSSKLIFEKHPRGYELLSQGAHAKYLWFIVKGAVRNFETEGGIEKTYRFMVENDFFINIESILTKKPSLYSYVCEEDCELFKITHSDLMEVYRRSHYFERTGRIFAQLAMIREMNNQRMLLSMNASQRYEYLMKLQPDIFHRFMQKHIASMLGITPVSLSRLRSQSKAKQKNARKS